METSKRNLHLRQVCSTDRELLFVWANDSVVRANAFHTEQIPYADHVKWFADMMADNAIYQYILCENEIPVGQIRFNMEGDRAFIDYSIAAKFRGMGYGTALIQLLLQELETAKIPNEITFVGQVKRENHASANVFEKCGFTPVKKKDYIQYELVWRRHGMRIIIATIKSWNIARAQALQEKYRGVHDICIFTKKEEFTAERVCDFQPDYIFLPHWSYIMPREITDNWECVLFHMTDLPYGRGGSPLQNLIVRGHKETKISAIKMTEKLDGGPVYMKHALSLEGSAQEIFIRCADIIFAKMIPLFLEGGSQQKLKPVPQQGEPVVFKRRKPEESRLTPEMDLEKIYDYIRMLDAEGYPKAFLEFGKYCLEFGQADFSKEKKELSARVVFRCKEEDLENEDHIGGGSAPR